MKTLGNLMKSLSPRRPSASNRKRRISKLKEEQSLGCSSLMSTSSGTSTAAADAAWRVEHIRVAAPDEQEWWKPEEEDDTTCMLSSGVSESMDDSIEMCSNSKSLVSKSSTSSSATDGTSTSLRFHNCGLETWEKTRAAWTARPDNVVVQASRQPVNRKELEKALKKASSLRTYELPRRMPLPDLIDSYVTVWNGEE